MTENINSNYCNAHNPQSSNLNNESMLCNCGNFRMMFCISRPYMQIEQYHQNIDSNVSDSYTSQQHEADLKPMLQMLAS